MESSFLWGYRRTSSPPSCKHLVDSETRRASCLSAVPLQPPWSLPPHTFSGASGGVLLHANHTAAPPITALWTGVLPDAQGDDVSVCVLPGGVVQQRYGGMAVILLRCHLMGFAGRVDGAGVASATAAEDDLAQRSDEDPVETSPGAFADETVEGRVGHTVQRGQQKGQVIVVKDPWKVQRGVKDLP